MNPRTKTLLVFAGGVALGVALPIVVPAIIEGGRPLMKALVKHSTLGIQRVQVLAARAAESLEDLFAEVRAESQPVAASVVSAIPAAPVDKKTLS
ncbi:MAG TPA: DUF5132 domain-containing protein [Polyangiales bacterium]|nr:DUF5132 domain-containing protein [Polyangiales bacterium]